MDGTTGGHPIPPLCSTMVHWRMCPDSFLISTEGYSLMMMRELHLSQGEAELNVPSLEKV